MASTSNGERKCVLVTGGGGFIGSHVAEFLLRRKDRVVVVDEANDFGYESEVGHFAERALIYSLDFAS